MHLTGRIRIVIMLIAVLFAAASCTKDWTDDMEPVPGQTSDYPDRTTSRDSRKVMLLYIAGYNNLKDYLQNNLDDLMTGWIPESSRTNDVLLVYSHLPVSRSNYSTPTEPVLTRIYKDSEGKAVKDTIKIYSPDTISASASHLSDVLTLVRNEFPAKSYGLVFSSHANGYLPVGFYNSPHSYVFDEDRQYRSGRRTYGPTSAPYVETWRDPSLPEVKSIGQSRQNGRSYEMDIRDFADAIPMKLDYILFDACLMGGIEVAYEFKDKCDRIAFSPTEVLAQGFNYATITTHLLNNTDESHPELVCEDYFNYYNDQSGSNRSATVSMVDCRRLEPVSEICRELFGKYRSGLDNISYSAVQRFYTSNYHWFYDLESIMQAAGADEADMKRLRDAIDGCMIYRGWTPSFLGSFTIDTFCGFSMYLPCNGNRELDKYYKTLRWNQATGLVK